MESGSTMARSRENGLSTSNDIVPRRTSSSSISSGVKYDAGDGMLLSTIQRNARQKARRILEDSWQVNGLQAARVKCNSCTVNKYSIVASRGELARNNCASRETPAPCIVNKKSTRAKHRDSFLEEKFSGKQLPSDATGSKDYKKLERAIHKSFSVPVDLREGVSTSEKIVARPTEEGILKKSSAFLANLTHSASRVTEKRTNDGSTRLRKACSDIYGAENDVSNKYTSLKGYFSILSSVTSATSATSANQPLRRSPSVQTLPIERKKKSGGRVKKSVSFSSDTSFEEKRAPYRRAAVHEVKVYHQGVLQDRNARENLVVTKVPPPWETPSEGRSALLRAARDADDAALNQIAVQVRKLGFGDMDVNIADGSGRTAISYMAGNGASTMLELALSFEGVDPNIPDNEGNTPLHFAAQAGQTECLNILLQRCPDIEVDARNASGFTPLMKAALQGRTKCAKILLFAGANPTLRDQGRGLRAEQWARFCGRYVCAEVIERFARHRLLERSTSCRWGSEPELAAKVLQGKVVPIPTTPLSSPSSGLKSKIRKVFRTTSGPDRSFSLVSQLTSAALCASSPALPKSSEVPPVVKSLLRPLSVPQLRVTLVSPQDFLEQTKDKYGSNFTEKIENTAVKPSRSKKKSK